MPSAAYATTVEITGTSTAIVAEACALVTGTTYQITNTARRVLDPAVAVTVKDGGVAIPAANVDIDYLFGKFTLTAPPGGAVTVDASYLPALPLAECESYDLD